MIAQPAEIPAALVRWLESPSMPRASSHQNYLQGGEVKGGTRK
jgi:hypothetical protein